ncbi:MAG TPA: large conductance mechanosensitive channel protein MscL [Thermomicrobiales bacterium]|nr:large conductance mechanosensitive channel protein MscL [Thermomicrobiales bacterium]
MRGAFDEFKQFLLRGNVVDLAVAVVIGAAFGTVVTAFVDNLVMPLIALLGGEPDFTSIGFTISDTYFGVGAFLTALVSFAIIAAVIFFFVVKPMNLLTERMAKAPTPDPTTWKCLYCYSEVTIGATRCPHCTSEIPATPPPAEVAAPA